MITCTQNQEKFERSIYPQLFSKWLPHQEGKKCKTCEGNINIVKTKSSEYGEITLYPEECDKCRKKAYKAYIKDMELENYLLARSRCCGYQNKPQKHDGKFVCWENLSHSLPGQSEILNYIESFINGNTKGALITGSVGLGKTFLCKILHNTLIKQNRHTAMLRMVDMSIILRKETFGDQYKKVLNEFQKVPLLIIDDYGAQKNTEWVRETFFSIIDYRYEHNLPTIFNTNLSEVGLRKFDTRIASRLLAKNWLKRIDLFGDDVRKTFLYN